MTAANHITGGTVFSGIFASLWDINIFSDFNLLVVCTFASLLPDIDHTKSPIGKAFYPLARYIDRKFGHRTITHSLVFMIPAVAIVSSFFSFNITLIFALGLTSHLLFDMVTVQGIPLFYPFFKNPCVLPANPEARIRSGNTRAELTAFVLFIICGTFCYPLMANGFWLTFNKTLGSKKQLISEFKRSDKILMVEYTFRRDFETISGVGLCLQALESHIIFYDTTTHKFVHLGLTDVPKSFTPSFTKFTSFDQISATTSLANTDRPDTLFNQPILQATIFSTNPITLSHDTKSTTGQHFIFEYTNQLSMASNKSENQQFKLKQLKKSHLIQAFQLSSQKFNQALVVKKKLEEEYNTASDYRKSQITKQLQSINPVQPDKRSFNNQLEIINEEIRQLQLQQSPDSKLFGTIKLLNQ